MNPFQKMTDDAVAAIRGLHERGNADDLEGVMAHIADDVVAMAPGASFIQGKEAFRALYGALLSAGAFHITEDIQEVRVLGDYVLARGMTVGTQTMKSGGAIVEVANNFIFVFRYGPSGKMQFWRVAFAPAK
jgi:ketosteroid isomerase-like protein